MREREFWHASPSEWDSFRGLWAQFLAEHPTVLPTARSWAFFEYLFKEYASGGLPGCAFLGPQVVHLSGGAGEPPLDMTHGRVAYGWGTYVVPAGRGCGLASRVREAAAQRLTGLGFSAMVGGVRVGDGRAYQSGLRSGFEPTEVQMIRRLGG